LDLVWDAAQAYVRSVPNFTCKETVHSEQVGFTNRPIHWIMNTKADFRVMRSENGTELKEERMISEKDGQILHPATTNITLPYKLSAAFGPPLGVYLSPEHRSCLNVHAVPGRVDFEAVPGLAGKGICSDIAPLARGFITFNPATGAPIHLERTVPDAVAAQVDFAAFGSIDYKPVIIPKHGTFPLPSHVVGRKTKGNLTYLFDASYSDCQKFGAETSITFK
jgi:hypothetical protein